MLRGPRKPVQHDENNPSRRGGGTAGRAHTSVLRSNLSAVLFHFLLQQRRSVSVSDGLNEGLVRPATGSRSTGPGLCVYYQSALVSTAGYIQLSAPTSSLPPSPPPTNPHLAHKRPHLQERAPTHPIPSPSPSLPRKLLQTSARSQCTALAHLHTHTHIHTHVHM